MKQENDQREKEQQGTAAGTSSAASPLRAGQGQQQSEADSSSERRSQSGMKGGAQQKAQGGQMTAANGGSRQQPQQRQAGMVPRSWFDSALWMDNPFAMMRRFSEEMDRLFDDFRTGRGMLPAQSRGRAELSQWSPQIEMYEKDNQLVICTDLPGMKQEDIQLEVQENMLTIQGERRNDFEDTQEGYYRSERSYGSFLRTIPLPPGIETEQAKASFENGVLKVMFPLPQQQQRRRRIEVEAGAEQQASAGTQTESSQSSSTPQGA